MDHHLPPSSPTAWPSLWSVPIAAVEDDTHASELRQALFRTTLELESTRLVAQEELRRLEAQALELTHFLNVATRERDEARLHANSLLLLLDQRGCPAQASSSEEEESSRYTCPAAMTEEEIEAAAMRRELPEKGRLLEAVMEAGPLLQTLMLAGPLPEWRHPPPAVTNFEIPPVMVTSGDQTSRRDASPPDLILKRNAPF